MNPETCVMLSGKAAMGRKVSDFAFETFNPAQGGFEDHSLNEYLQKGHWVVIFFYPADFTFVCPTELADLADQRKKFQELGVEVISVSTDTKFAHMAWQRSEKFLEDVKFQMAADGTGCISRYFGVYDEASGTAYRGTFIISPDGTLVSAEVNLNNVGRNVDELIRKLEANVHLAKNPEQACPARWKPGQRTLRPSEEIVGKVWGALKL
ncbi:Alkyl hydroperoxide reductase subunit C [uncultured delta proteobacterium]|uniref:Alkyl hydroperoxide reductase subunit C n=1 Tax=uncultured delta proteobacterium TaxID=34034 RepID=A0A212K7F6_9DELT|nr:Alkyl hydroperoxide reductase subunit C [uncultured delta proteobacterium]